MREIPMQSNDSLLLPFDVRVIIVSQHDEHQQCDDIHCKDSICEYLKDVKFVLAGLLIVEKCLRVDHFHVLPVIVKELELIIGGEDQLWLNNPNGSQCIVVILNKLLDSYLDLHLLEYKLHFPIIKRVVFDASQRSSILQVHLNVTDKQLALPTDACISICEDINTSKRDIWSNAVVIKSSDTIVAYLQELVVV